MSTPITNPSHEEVLAEFGLTLEDFERMGRTPLDPHSKGAVLPAFRARV